MASSTQIRELGQFAAAPSSSKHVIEAVTSQPRLKATTGSIDKKSDLVQEIPATSPKKPKHGIEEVTNVELSSLARKTNTKEATIMQSGQLWSKQNGAHQNKGWGLRGILPVGAWLGKLTTATSVQRTILSFAATPARSVRASLAKYPGTRVRLVRNIVAMAFRTGSSLLARSKIGVEERLSEAAIKKIAKNVHDRRAVFES